MSKTIIIAAVEAVAVISAELGKVENRIEHINWLLSPSRIMMPFGFEQLETERMMLMHQTRGNLMVDLRDAMRALESEVSR